jgi:ABC-type enterobactin transport system permease subunit
MAGVFTAAIIWLLDWQRELTYSESVFITVSAMLMFFSIVAILFSFGDTSVYSHGEILDEGSVNF